MEKKCKKAKWLSEEALQIAVKRREAKTKGAKDRYKHLNAEFQRIARRDKKAFLKDQCKEIGKTTEGERLEISSRKLEIPREHFMQRCLYLSFSPLLFASLLSTAICKASSDSHLTSLHFFFLGMVFIPVSCTMSQISVHSSSGTLSDLGPEIYFSLPLYNHKGFDLGHT